MFRTTTLNTFVPFRSTCVLRRRTSVVQVLLQNRQIMNHPSTTNRVVTPPVSTVTMTTHRWNGSTSNGVLPLRNHHRPISSSLSFSSPTSPQPYRFRFPTPPILQQQRPSSKSSSFRSFTTTSSNTNTSDATAKSSQSFMEWYEQCLSAHPVLTKMITGSFLWGIGDGVAQIIPQCSSSSSRSKDDDDTAAAAAAANDTKDVAVPFTYDYIRTGRAALFGCIIHAPMSHVHYNFLEYITVHLKFTGYYIPIFKAFMEQFVYWSWISNSIYFAAMGAMQGMNLSQIYQRIYDVLWETQVAQWTFWIPIQLINFQYTPVRHQLNVVLLTSIVWTALLSMWYPPIQPSSSTTKDEVDPKPTTTTEEENVVVVPK